LLNNLNTELQMADPIGIQLGGVSSQPPINRTPVQKGASDAQSIGQKFEQMLWAEMLSHAGLEKAFSQGGGEAASAFSRYMVEAVAKDLAASHPMGLAAAVEADLATTQRSE
jgi:hypothetical protein